MAAAYMSLPMYALKSKGSNSRVSLTGIIKRCLALPDPIVGIV